MKSDLSRNSQFNIDFNNNNQNAINKANDVLLRVLTNITMTDSTYDNLNNASVVKNETISNGTSSFFISEENDVIAYLNYFLIGLF